MDFQTAIQEADRLEALGDAASLQAAHDLLLQHPTAGYGEAEIERIWARIFNLRDLIWEAAGLPPVSLSDADLAGFKVVSVDN